MNRQQEILLLNAAAVSVVTIIQALSKLVDNDISGRKRRRKVWTRKWISRRIEGKGALHMLNNELLLEDPTSYRDYLRMSNLSFEKLLSEAEIHLTKQDTVMRESISARSKLETTLRFLATGETYRSLMYSTRIHESTISRFVPVVCGIIYRTPNDQDTWLKIADGFMESWQFPNCIGALDGRHIKFRPPISAGSFYYNYKGDHSIVLLAMADSAYRFTYYNVGINGRISDGGVFRESGLSKALSQNGLNLPHHKALSGRQLKVPYVIIADDAFPISTTIMKPFPHRNLTYEQKVFNYRLSRARRIIESAFGILANRFRVLLNSISLKPEKVEIITLACIALHNFLATENWRTYTDISSEDKNLHQLRNIGQQGGNRCNTAAQRIREEFKEFFNSDAGAVDWQHNAVTRNNM